MAKLLGFARFGQLVALLALGQCGRGSDRPNAGSAPSGTSPTPVASTARAPETEPLADERVEIPTGAFQAGSVPGEAGRKPELEARRHAVELGSFQIDRLAYPNDPARAPLTNVERNEAKRLCAERGARLCTELEWERACKGPGSQPFAGSDVWDARCALTPKRCASGFDVLGLGAALREWTASDIVPSDTEQPRRASVRGAPGTAPGSAHRCAERSGIDGATKSPDLGFRCCKGAPNAAVVPEPKLEQTFRRTKLGAERLTKLLASDPRTLELAKDVKFFRDPDAANTVVARGSGDKKGFLFTVAPLLWNPIAGSEFLVVTARSGEDKSFIVVYYALGQDEYRLASSFVMKSEPGPIALVYSGYIRPRLHFSTCWGCPGETGKILHRDPDSVVVLQP